MSEKNVYMMPNLITPNKPIVIDEKVCNGCNRCVKNCMMDVLYPNPEKGGPPIVLYPDECWYCGCCAMECPLWEKGAIKLVHPICQRVRWKRKSSGEDFRVGMKNPPPTNSRPPVGGWKPKAYKNGAQLK
ncbi:MAG: ferredoxin family protein [Deltaproteobacteria bacterium]|nr:ferredoxin family protein [Deltaproteobacteria bacterium]